MKKGFIDYEGVEEVITDIEEVFKLHQLNVDEKRFTIGHLLNRINMSEQTRKANELAQSMDIKTIMSMAGKNLFGK